jgi:protein-tyrosine phosphatase
MWLSLALCLAGCCHRPPPPPRQEPKPSPPRTQTCDPYRVSLDPGLRRVLSEGGIEPERIHCNTLVRWERSLKRYAERAVEGLAELWGAPPDPAKKDVIVHRVLGFLVRSFYDQVHPHNMGVVRIKGHWFRDDTGRRRPLLLFRSAVTTPTSERRECFESLIRHGAVRHIINLYGGSFPFYDLIDEEKKVAKTLGAAYFDAAREPRLVYRGLVKREEEYQANLPKAMDNMAVLIRDKLLRPEGEPPKGNLYIHCGGGMHRSGMLFGVLRRCINGESMELIETEYKRHTGYESAERPGGYEALNIRFIRDFDCSLLKKSPSPDAGTR